MQAMDLGAIPLITLAIRFLDHEVPEMASATMILILILILSAVAVAVRVAFLWTL